MICTETFVLITIYSLKLAKVMNKALADGARRKALLAIATPTPASARDLKRRLKTTPEVLSSRSTVTPDPKRHMSDSAEGSSSSSVVVVEECPRRVEGVAPTQLFPTPPCATQHVAARTSDNETFQPTQVDESMTKDDDALAG